MRFVRSSHTAACFGVALVLTACDQHASEQNGTHSVAKVASMPLKASHAAHTRLPSWVMQRSEHIASVACYEPVDKNAKLDCKLEGWFDDLNGCRIDHMFSNALKNYANIRQEWRNPANLRFQVDTVVCRGKTGCSRAIAKLLCIDTNNRLVYEIDDVSHFFGQLEPMRLEEYQP